MPGLPVSSRAPRSKIVVALLLGNAAAVVLDLDLDAFRRRLHGHEDAAAAIFGGILDQIAEHLVEILALDPDRRLLVRRRDRR